MSDRAVFTDRQLREVVEHHQIIGMRLLAEDVLTLRAENGRLKAIIVKASSVMSGSEQVEIGRLKSDLTIAEGVIERNEASIAALTKERDEAKAIGCVCLNAFKALQMASENKIDEKTFVSVIESSAIEMGQAADWLKAYTDTLIDQINEKTSERDNALRYTELLIAQRDHLREQLAEARVRISKLTERIEVVACEMPRGETK